MKFSVIKQNIVVLFVGLALGYGLNAFLSTPGMSTGGEIGVMPASEQGEGVTAGGLPGSLPSLFARYENLGGAGFVEELGSLNKRSQADQLLHGAALFSVWAESDPEGALQAAKELDANRAEMADVVFGVWGKSSPVEAAEFYRRNQNSFFEHNDLEPWKQRSASKVIAGHLAKADLNQSLEWMRTLASFADRDEALKGIIGQMFEVSPQMAYQKISGFDEREKKVAIGALARTWVIRNEDGAIDWFNRLSSVEQDVALSQMTKSMAEVRPDLAANVYYEHLEKEEQDDVLAVISDKWSLRDPDSALEWIKQTADVEQQSYFLDKAIANWVGTDPAKAREWISRQDEGETKDIAVRAFVREAALGYMQPVDLVELSQSEIRDVRLRELAINDALVVWARTHPELAETYANQLNLSSEALTDFYYQIKAESDL